jgi:putative FmdB family regulatory protein
VPTYEYRCKDCDHGFDVVQAFTDAPLTECPSCGGTLRKVFGNVGITFKGSGFYKTDSRSSANGSKPEKTSSDGDGATKPDSSSPAKDPSSSKGSPSKDTTTKKGDAPSKSAAASA